MISGPSAAIRVYTSSTADWNARSSTVMSADRTITISFTFSGPRSLSSSSVAPFFDSGLLVNSMSVVRAPARRGAVTPMDATSRAAQMPITVQGRRALMVASASVDMNAMGHTPSGAGLAAVSRPEDQRYPAGRSVVTRLLVAGFFRYLAGEPCPLRIFAALPVDRPHQLFRDVRLHHAPPSSIRPSQKRPVIIALSAST